MRRVLAITALSVLLAQGLFAAAYKGQKEFIKNCAECHVKKQEFISSKTSYQWKDLMVNDGEALVKLHLSKESAKESWEYFEGSRFKKKAKDLRDFFLEYASDSGNVPACN
ncbi:MAG: cytochrome C [Epsilonproteobacteria bacterium]|nr:cytochrome C [Campylobacterota bacterium]